MRAIKLALLELRRFRGPLRRFVPIVLILVPLLYGSLYLWSNWDPYGRLDQVPVAVVNEDRPAVAHGERVAAGDQFVQQLKANEIFDWRFTNARDAREGLEHGRYYFTITVPQDFSAKLATAADPDPQRASVHIVRNDANGFIVGIMADTVKSELQNQINAAAHSAYARALYGELATVRDKMRVAARASDRLVSGTELNQQGTSALTSGLAGIRGATGRISEGVNTVSASAAQLNDQVTELTNLAAERVPAAANATANATGAAQQALGTVATVTGVVADRSAGGLDHLRELGRTHPDLRQDPLYQRSVGNAEQLAAAARQANDDANAALSSIRDAHARAVAIRDNTGPLQNRVRAIATPTATLRTGTSQIADGTSQLTTGLDGLLSGGEVLRSGADQLNGGARDLSAAVHDGLRRIPATDPEQVAHAADVLGSPTNLETRNLNPAGVYGRGLAPFFFAIALWVFGLFAYLLIKPVNLRALAGRTRALTITVAGWLPAAGLGVVGGLVLFTIVDLGLGLAPAHLLPTLGVITLAAAAFVAIDHFLRTSLGTIGDLISLVLLIVQLTACGGLYPVETTPAPFRAIHPLLPMSYLVDALRITISGGLAEHLWRDVVVLGSFLVAFLALTTLVVHRQRTWTVSRLHPQIDL